MRHAHHCELPDNSLIFASFWKVQLVPGRSQRASPRFTVVSWLLWVCVREGARGKGRAEEAERAESPAEPSPSSE